MTKIDLQQIGFTDSTSTLINSNSAEIETKSDTFLSRNGATPNEMLADLDMNSNRIMNLPAPLSSGEPIRVQDLVNGSLTVPDLANITVTTKPLTNDGVALGTGTKSWSDLFLANGAVINFNNGDVVLTHAVNNLAFTGATNYTFDSPATFTLTTGGGLLGLMGNAGTDRYITYYTTGFHPRFTTGITAIAESGGNAGSDWFVARWSDADGFIDIPLSINRASGNVGFSQSLSAVGTCLIHNSTSIPAGGTAGVGYKFSSTVNFGVFFGSGAPTLSAAKGSLYLRSDGSATNNRAFINTDGGTTWTAITTAA